MAGRSPGYQRRRGQIPSTQGDEDVAMSKG